MLFPIMSIVNERTEDKLVGHTGHDPVKHPLSVGCTTPVLGGLYVNFAYHMTLLGSKSILQTSYSQ
jgi:hypothetical protein